jgi:hypothetical protein
MDSLGFRMSRSVLASFSVVAAAALAAAPGASADTTLGASDISAQPTIGCGQKPCTATQLQATSTSPTVVVPADGTIVSARFHHGAYSDPPGQIGVVPGASLVVLTGSGQTFTVASASLSETPSHSDGIDAFSLSSSGVTVHAGDRLGVSIAGRGDVPIFVAGQGGATAPYGDGQQAFTPVAGELMLQATFRPSAQPSPQQSPSPSPSPSGGPSQGPSDGLPADFGAIKPFFANEITAFHAQTVKVYRAPIIKPYHSKVNLADAIMRGFSAPVNCSLPCQLTAYASMRGISASLLGMMARKPRTVVVASSSGSLPAAGTAVLRVPLLPRVRAALRAHRRTVSVKLNVAVRDGRKVTVMRRMVTLIARH